MRAPYPFLQSTALLQRMSVQTARIRFPCYSFQNCTRRFPRSHIYNGCTHGSTLRYLHSKPEETLTGSFQTVVKGNSDTSIKLHDEDEPVDSSFERFVRGNEKLISKELHADGEPARKGFGRLAKENDGFSSISVGSGEGQSESFGKSSKGNNEFSVTSLEGEVKNQRLANGNHDDFLFGKPDTNNHFSLSAELKSAGNRPWLPSANDELSNGNAGNRTRNRTNSMKTSEPHFKSSPTRHGSNHELQHENHRNLDTNYYSKNINSGHHHQRKQRNSQSRWDGNTHFQRTPQARYNKFNSDNSGHHLEQRTRAQLDQIRNGMAHGSDPLSSSSWHRTAVAIILEWTKLWGRQSRLKSSRGPRQRAGNLVHTGVELSHQLIMHILDTKEREFGEFSRSVENNGDEKSEVFDAGLLDRDESKKFSRYVHSLEYSARKRINDTEALCQLIALGWSRCNPEIVPDAAFKAQTLLDRLEKLSLQLENLPESPFEIENQIQAKQRDVLPSPTLYNHVISCWSRSLDPNAEIYANKIIERMKSGDGTFQRPQTITYNNMLNLYANKGDVNKVESLLREMEQPDHPAPADVFSYTILMNSLQKRFVSGGYHRDLGDPKRAEEILLRIVKRYEQSGSMDASLRPNHVAFGTVLSMYAAVERFKMGSHQSRAWKAMVLSKVNQSEGKGVLSTTRGWGAENAERVLEWIIGLYEREKKLKFSNSDYRDNDYGQCIKPCSQHFVTTIDAWAKAGRGVEGARKCERLLDRLCTLYENSGGDPDLKPAPVCFGAVINAWAKADNEQETVEHAEELLFRMEDLFLHSNNPKESLSEVAYNLVIDAWSRRTGSNAAERAEQIFERMMKNYHQTKNHSLRPDVISYSGVMKAYSDHPSGGEKALELLRKMYEQYEQGNSRAKPDTKALAIAIDACAKNNLTTEAERILNDVKDSEKTRVLFNSVLSGYKKEGRAVEAEDMLRRMVKLADLGFKNCSPDSISYSSCIEAWGKSDNPDFLSRAEALLDECKERFRTGDEQCKLHPTHFNSLANAVVERGLPNAENEVLRIFGKMEETDCGLSLHSFNILIKSCSYATESDERKQHALEVATSAFGSLDKVGLEADSVTYIGMIHVISNLLSDTSERVKALAGIFKRCCDEGCVNQHILDILSSATNEKEFATVTGVTSPTNIDALPSEWKTNSSEKGLDL